MQNKSSVRLIQFLALAALYLIILLRWGYEYGRGDQMQVLGYAKYIGNHALYPLDQYIQGMAEKVPNERFLFSWFLSLSGRYMEIFSLVAHFLSTLGLLVVLQKISSGFIKSAHLSMLAIFILFIPFYGINLGGNELYYNSFFVSNWVKLLGIIAIWQFLEKNISLSYFLVGLATLFQPVVGVQLFVTFSAILFFRFLIEKRSPFPIRRLIMSLGLFLFTGGLWVLFLKFFFEENAGISNREFFHILFEFRSPHHYLPFSFPLKNYLILIPLFAFSAWYYFQRSREIFFFFLVSFGFLGLYTLLVEGFQIVDVTSLQWFKITIWLKAFSIIALVAFLEEKWKFLSGVFLSKIAIPILFLTGATALAIMIIRPQELPWTVNYDFGGQYQNDAAVEICLAAKESTPMGALFIHPIGFTELKVYGERSSFVEYKILVHRKKAMEEWYQRLKMVYGIQDENPREGYALIPEAELQFAKLDVAKLKEWKARYGITHILTYANHNLDLRLTASNSKFRIYEI